jgi:hypothetical protein
MSDSKPLSGAAGGKGGVVAVGGTGVGGTKVGVGGIGVDVGGTGVAVGGTGVGVGGTGVAVGGSGVGVSVGGTGVGVSVGGSGVGVQVGAGVAVEVAVAVDAGVVSIRARGGDAPPDEDAGCPPSPAVSNWTASAPVKAHTAIVAARGRTPAAMSEAPILCRFVVSLPASAERRTSSGLQPHTPCGEMLARLF